MASGEDLGERALAARRGHAEPLSRRRGKVRETAAHAEIDVAANRRTGDEQRHVLARVVGRNVRRFAAVVRGHQQQILRPESGEHLGQEGVQTDEVVRETRRVVAVAVLAVEVDQVREDDVRLRRAKGFDRDSDPLRVRAGVHRRR